MPPLPPPDPPDPPDPQTAVPPDPRAAARATWRRAAAREIAELGHPGLAALVQAVCSAHVYSASGCDSRCTCPSSSRRPPPPVPVPAVPPVFEPTTGTRAPASALADAGHAAAAGGAPRPGGPAVSRIATEVGTARSTPVEASGRSRSCSRSANRPLRPRSSPRKSRTFARCSRCRRKDPRTAPGRLLPRPGRFRRSRSRPAPGHCSSSSGPEGGSKSRKQAKRRDEES